MRDQAHFYQIQLDQLPQPVDVPRIRDRRYERPPIGVVERRRELADVDRKRGGAGAGERSDDVDALPGAGEEDCGHGERA